MQGLIVAWDLVEVNFFGNHGLTGLVVHPRAANLMSSGFYFTLHYGVVFLE